uniref:Tumor suppressor 2, mitochondrial calcium regulator b n=1 Tax=Sphaeramia orbicularis TaxID=375764 RepID=A0A672ZZH5_9TELE
MGGSGSKAKGVWPFSGSGVGGDSACDGNEQSLARLKGSRNATPFVFTRRSSLYYDEDGDLAHEFYEETVVTKNGRKKSKLKRIQKNLIPQVSLAPGDRCYRYDFACMSCFLSTAIPIEITILCFILHYREL